MYECFSLTVLIFSCHIDVTINDVILHVETKVFYYYYRLSIQQIVEGQEQSLVRVQL